MCGIVGYSGNFDKYLLQDCVESLAHRGPDANGIFVDDKNHIGLGHTRLTIIDLDDSANQPLLDADGDLVIVFNGEIYNFQSLRNKLMSQGCEFKTNSDTEVLLMSYRIYGYNLLEEIEGIFAFAIWDRRKKTLFIARDAVGVKPLYYSQTSDGFIFASEIKSLVKSKAISRKLDKYAIHNYLSFLWSPGERTMFDSIKKLDPGGAILIRDNEIAKRWNWYQLPGLLTKKRNIKKDDYIEKCREELSKAVKKQLVSDVPVGAFLSGGLDSSAIVAMAKKYNPSISCFTIETIGGNEEGFADDLPYAKKVANHLDVPLSIIKIEQKKMVSDIEEMIYQLDEPLADPACLNVMYISQLAREKGIKVLLSGTGGDDILTGYRRHRAIKYDNLIGHLPHFLRSNLMDLSSHLSQKNSFFRRLSKYMDGIDLEGDARIFNYYLWPTRVMLNNIYSENFKKDLGDYDASSVMSKYLSNYENIDDNLNKALLLDQRFFLSDHNLIYTDKMSMAKGVEVRVPFLDQDFIDFAANIPLNLKQNSGQEKWILKKAMEPYLPDEIIYRSKTGFGAPLRDWLKGEMEDFVLDNLSETNIKKRDIFDYDAVMDLVMKNRNGNIDASYVIFSILCIELWCQKFID